MLGILKIMWDISSLFLIVNYNVLTETCYKVQINSKITDLDSSSSF